MHNAQRRKCQFDVHKVGDSRNDSIFLEEISKYSHPPYNMDNTSHLHHVHTSLYNAACAAYPYSRRCEYDTAGRTARLTGYTIGKIRSRAALLSRLERLQKAYNRAHVYSTFQAWSGNARVRFHTVRGFVTWRMIRNLVYFQSALQNLNNEVKYLVSMEKAVSLNDMHDLLALDLENDNVLGMYKHMRRLKNSKKSKKCLESMTGMIILPMTSWTRSVLSEITSLANLMVNLSVLRLLLREPELTPAH